MHVFLSWSGSESKAVAKALHEWLPLVLPVVEPWMSDVDIQTGTRWSPTIAGQLEASNFGIVCLTEQNLDAPWLMFEAGALSKAVRDDARVVPYLIGIESSAVQGPLADFHHSKADQAGTYSMVKSLNSATGDQARPDVALERVFDALWPELQQLLEARAQGDGPARPRRTSEDILEELLLLARENTRLASGLEMATRMLEQQWVQMAMKDPTSLLGLMSKGFMDILPVDAQIKVLRDHLAQVQATEDEGAQAAVQYLLQATELRQQYEARARANLPSAWSPPQSLGLPTPWTPKTRGPWIRPTSEPPVP